jgi:uncharacterized protein (DUF169 family)
LRPLKTDLSIYRKFDFTNPLVDIKYLTQKPEGIEQLDKNLRLCEMPKEAHVRGTSFYFTKENEAYLGKSFLGMVESRPTSGTGQIGVDFEIFQEARANRNIYPHQYLIGYGIVNYVVVAPLDSITFEPDLLFIMATVSQAEILLRAMSYSTGEIWSTKLTGVGACTWLFVI